MQRKERYAMRMPISSTTQSSLTHFSTSCTRLPIDPTSTAPLPRSGHRLASDNRFVFSFGGYKPSSNHEQTGLSPELWQFDRKDRRWTLLSKMGPQETASHSMILTNQCLIIFGGTGYPWGHRISNTLHVFHLSSRRWFSLPCVGDFPSKRYGHTMNLYGDYLYIVGGTTGILYNISVYRLHLKTLQWQNVSPLQDSTQSSYYPEPRYRHESAVFGDLLFIFGGVASEVVFDLVNIPVFDLKANHWSYRKSKPCLRMGTYPSPRKFFAAAQFGRLVYLCGGIIHGMPLNDIWSFDLADLQWRQLHQQLPTPLYFHSITVSPSGCMIVFGGVEINPKEKRSNKLFKTWLVVPSLKEMVMDVFPKFCKSTSSQSLLKFATSSISDVDLSFKK